VAKSGLRRRRQVGAGVPFQGEMGELPEHHPHRVLLAKLFLTAITS
jgi:hypothetical protein